MTCHFYVGQKVVAVRDQNPDEYQRSVWDAWAARGLTMPEHMGVYTIRKIKMGHNRRDGWMTCILLEEIVNPEVNLSGGSVGEPGFWHASFRPLVERKTDISIFQAMLTRPRLGVRA